MLKVSHWTPLGTEGARFGINFDGFIIITTSPPNNLEVHIHPDDLKPGNHRYVAGTGSFNITKINVKEIMDVLDQWESEGHAVLEKTVIRPRSAKIPAEGVQTDAGLSHGDIEGISLPTFPEIISQTNHLLKGTIVVLFQEDITKDKAIQIGNELGLTWEQPKDGVDVNEYYESGKIAIFDCPIGKEEEKIIEIKKQTGVITAERQHVCQA